MEQDSNDQAEANKFNSPFVLFFKNEGCEKKNQPARDRPTRVSKRGSDRNDPASVSRQPTTGNAVKSFGRPRNFLRLSADRPDGRERFLLLNPAETQWSSTPGWLEEGSPFEFFTNDRPNPPSSFFLEGFLHHPLTSGGQAQTRAQSSLVGRERPYRKEENYHDVHREWAPSITRSKENTLSHVRRPRPLSCLL